MRAKGSGKLSEAILGIWRICWMCGQAGGTSIFLCVELTAEVSDPPPPCFSSIQLQDSYKGHSLLLQTYVVKIEEFPFCRQKLSDPLALIPIPLALMFFLLLLLQCSLILEEVI